jgi:hypothetical protein
MCCRQPRSLLFVRILFVVLDEVGHLMGLIDPTGSDFNGGDYLTEGINGPVRFIREKWFSFLP